MYRHYLGYVYWTFIYYFLAILISYKCLLFPMAFLLINICFALHHRINVFKTSIESCKNKVIWCTLFKKGTLFDWIVWIIVYNRIYWIRIWRINTRARLLLIIITTFILRFINSRHIKLKHIRKTRVFSIFTYAATAWCHCNNIYAYIIK